ncbi:hypothetical protein PIB30_034747 [Stylosanthes scabra]|uniref:Uncharacterized protein n=1 Tax=Stylosanthes scabra TaxID=79078 RepID=A0ABU6YDK6_9FABA|nr:hypothetical protein [Stylosanthes scabra]
MPIYHDYHGDSRSSSISIWDQIQINLKSLLPSYEPILCDSTVVASFLSDQPQKHLSADFEQNSVSDQELTTDPTQFHQIQEITDLDFQFQFQSELATTRSSKFKFNQNSSSSKTDQATIHNTEPEFHQSDPEIQVHTQSDTEPKSSAGNFKFDQRSISVSTTTTPTEASDCSGFPKITKQIDEEVKFVPCGGANGWIEGDRQWPETVMEIGGCLRLACKEGREEELWVPLAEPPRPWMTEWGQNDKVAIGAEDGTATKGRIEITTLKPEAEAVATRPPPASPNTEPAVIQAAVMPYTEERVERPPPKPSHLNPYTAALGDSSTAKILVSGRIGAMDDGGEQDTSNNVVSAEEMQTWVTTVVEGELTTGAVVGASAKEKRRTIVAGVDATMTEGGFRAKQLRRFLSLNPPPLLAAVLPWDHDRSKMREAGGGTMDDGLYKMMTGGLLADETQKMVIHTVRTHEGGALHGGTTQ